MTKFDFKALKKSYANGAILRIKLENFVTYDSLEFCPGANLNVIIGPNGTGKSSIVCAICLGMAGKPSVLGRANSIAEYIKYGCSSSLIEIELNNHKGNNYIIKRIITKDSKSEWYLNDKQAKLKEIEELISSLNIQVGNLCQFLPQEKVAEFARLNSYDLLESTEKAVGGIELYEKHLELKDNSKATKELEKEVEAATNNLTKEETINARLKNQVESYLERKKFEDNVIWLKRKRALMIYSEKKAEHESMKKEKEKVDAEIKAYKEQKEPLEQRKAEIDQKLVRLKALLTTKTNEIQETAKNARSINIKLDEQTEKAFEIKSDYQSKENEIKQRVDENTKLREEIDQLKRQMQDENLDINALKVEEERIRAKEAELRRQNSQIQVKEYEIRQEMSKLKAELERILRSKNDIKNIREDKMNKLRSNGRLNDVLKAIDWLTNNKHKFKGEVYEPMFLSINIKNQNYAKFVESNISFKDLTSMFLFEKSEDMNLFFHEVRERMHLAVNSALIPNEPLSSFKPPKPIEEIRRFGFKTYLREIIDAPEAILVYLCLYSRIHQVPIGDEYSQRNISTILSEVPDLGRLYTNSHQYTVTRSRYTNQTSTSSSEVGKSYWLTLSIDTQKIAELENQEKQIQNQLKDLEAALRNHMEEKNEIDRKSEVLKASQNKIRERILYIDSFNRKLFLKQDRLRRNESEKTDMIGEAKKKAQQYYDVCKKRAKITNDILDITNRFISLNKDKIFANYQDSQLLNEKRKIESDLRGFVSRSTELTEKRERIDSQYVTLRDEAKVLLVEASKLNGVRLDKQESLPEAHRAKLDQLPSSLEQLESDIHQSEAIAACASDVDDRIVDEYTDRQKAIESLKTQLKKKQDKLNNQKQNYEDLKNEWLDKCDSMIAEISEKFSMLFKQLKCAGEVSLARPDNADEFSKYGIRIKVSFRSDEQLQELTAWQQSGGEKSVSTMMYMIALQEMTKCPFRVVDEINQGMDPINERKVFDIIVQNSCSKQFAQYFLLTPKLLPDLAFDEKTNVICVFNGPFNLKHSNYNLRQFIETRKKMNSTQG